MAEQLNIPESERELFLPGQAIQAFRDNQYRSTALAVGELIDNSIDAEARNVDLLCLEQQTADQTRMHWRIHELAVLDNGNGMSAERLVKALRFGARAPQRTRTIGKYGMGLPTSSVSQCRRVDVWTWQENIENPWHCFIDVDAVTDEGSAHVPEPDHEVIPDQWLRMASLDSINRQHGTLVVWRNIDRIKGRAETIFGQVAEEIGRIYRHFLNEHDLTIRMASFRANPSNPNREEYVKPNDPLYLMAPTSTPEPWNDEPMFTEWSRKVYPVNVEGRAEHVEVIYSLFKDEVVKNARAENRNPGDFLFGKHAARNRGVSIIRENREILLENAFVSGGGSSRDPQNRWWGCEVRFGSGCDILFGIDPNKQMAANFSRVARELIRDDDDDGPQLTLDSLTTEDYDLYKIVSDIVNNIGAIRQNINNIFARYPIVRRSTGESVIDQANATATQATREALVSGDMDRTTTDEERSSMSDEERISAISEALVNEGHSQADARESAQRIIERDDWYSCSWETLRSSQMFEVRNVGGVYRIILNAAHPIYEFIRLIEEASEDNAVARKAAVGIILMLQSWGHMEQQIANPERRRAVQYTADEWGKHVDEFIRRLNSEE